VQGQKNQELYIKASCFMFKHYRVEQAKLQLSSLLAIVGSIPNLILFLDTPKRLKLWASCLGICGAQSVTTMEWRRWLLLTTLRFGKVLLTFYQ
jgi:hypothetical protein